MRSFSFLVVLALAVLAAAASHDSAKRNVNLTRSSTSLDVRTPGHLSKRYTNARFTWYTDSEYACGDNPGGFIVALSPADFANGAHCYKTITLSFGGKTEQATVIDECAGCTAGQIDLSPNLFSAISSLGLGTVYGSWSFGGEAAPAPKPEPKPEPKPSPKPKPTTSSPPPPPPPTTSKHHTSSAPPPPPSTSATPTPTPPSTPSSSSSSTPSSTAVSSSAVVFADPSAATAGPVADAAGSALYGLNLAVIQLGVMLGQAESAH